MSCFACSAQLLLLTQSLSIIVNHCQPGTGVQTQERCSHNGSHAQSKCWFGACELCKWIPPSTFYGPSPLVISHCDLMAKTCQNDDVRMTDNDVIDAAAAGDDDAAAGDDDDDDDDDDD